MPAQVRAGAVAYAVSVEHERDLHGDAEMRDASVIDRDLLAFDPGRPDAVHRLRCFRDPSANRVLEALLRVR
jgi:hypothetical protein